MNFKQDLKKIENFFRKKNKIIFNKGICPLGYCEADKIVVNSNQSYEEKLKTIIHEFIHLAWKVDHNRLSRKAGYNSVNKDYFSEVIYGIIFPRRAFKRRK